jgi:hypothetical protein
MGGGMGDGSMARNRGRKNFMAFPWQMFPLVSTQNRHHDGAQDGQDEGGATIPTYRPLYIRRQKMTARCPPESTISLSNTSQIH